MKPPRNRPLTRLVRMKTDGYWLFPSCTRSAWARGNIAFTFLTTGANRPHSPLAYRLPPRLDSLAWEASANRSPLHAQTLAGLSELRSPLRSLSNQLRGADGRQRTLVSRQDPQAVDRTLARRRCEGPAARRSASRAGTVQQGGGAGIDQGPPRR